NSSWRNNLSCVDRHDFRCGIDRDPDLHDIGAVVVSGWISDSRTSDGPFHAGGIRPGGAAVTHNSTRWTVCGVALISFAAGGLLMRTSWADANRIYELRLSRRARQTFSDGVTVSRHDFQAARQTSSDGDRLLDWRRFARLQGHLRLSPF